MNPLVLFPLTVTLLLGGLPDEGGPQDEPPAPDERVVLPSFLRDRLQHGPQSLDPGEVERLVRQLAGLEAPSRSPAPTPTATPVSSRLRAWLLEKLAPLSPQRMLDTRSLRAVWRDLADGAEDPLSFHQLRNAGVGLPTFRELDRDGDGLVQEEEFQGLAIAGLRPEGWVVHPDLRHRLPAERGSEQGPGARPGVRHDHAILNSAQTQLGQAPSFVSEPEVDPYAGLGPIELADVLADELYPLPPPRRPSGGGWRRTGLGVSSSSSSPDAR